MEAVAEGILPNENETVVAVKAVKSRDDDDVVKALASELKIMIFLGHHPNVVNLFGAVTSNIAKRELLVIVELCACGNLKSFLIEHRSWFIDHTRDGLTAQSCAYINISSMTAANENFVCTGDLLSWAHQVALGMAYLASKKILHGDLAARNVLLTDSKVAKICDFGLSRSLYKDNYYRKTSKSPIPFKWLAPECLTELIFYTQSDVWSYGIFLWELFTLGQTPYPHVDTVKDLVTKIVAGYRVS